MKKVIKLVLVTMVALFINLGFANAQAPVDAKVQKATDKLCNSINGFIEALGVLDAELEVGTDKSITKAYNKTVSAYNKMIKNADHLENVEVKESVKSYNKLVDSVNKLSQDGITDDEAKQINANVDATAEEIGAILNNSCK